MWRCCKAAEGLKVLFGNIDAMDDAEVLVECVFELDVMDREGEEGGDNVLGMGMRVGELGLDLDGEVPRKDLGGDAAFGVA